MRRITAALGLLLCVAALPAARRAPADSQPQRLAALGKVWLTVKFSHPRVALTGRDWDQALIQAWPQLESAADDESFAKAVGAMLATIGDPITRVRRPTSPAGSEDAPNASAETAGRLSIQKIAGADEAMVIELRNAAAVTNGTALRKVIDGNLDGLKAASRIVVDLRGLVLPGAVAAQVLGALNDVLVSEALTLPASRVVMHSGYRAQAGGASFYSSRHTTEAATVVRPRAGYVKRRVVFLVDAESPLPPIALALQAAGTGAIVSTDAAPDPPLNVRSVPLGGGYSAVIRVEDLVVDGRRVEVRSDATITLEPDDTRMWTQALQMLDSARPADSTIQDPSPVWEPESGYADSPYPSEPLRLIAAYRLWGVLNYFFPYKHLLDRPWDEILPEFAPRILAAKDDLEYALTLSEMASRTNDSHVGVSGSRALTKWMGEAPTAVAVRFVEGKPIVTRVVDGAAAGGLAIGDEIVSVDGEAVDARAKRIEEHIAFSTKAGRDRVVAGRLLSGDTGSKARLGVRGANGQVREVVVERNARFQTRTQRDGDIVRVLEGNLGYADLERLEVADVPRMFDQLRDSIGIIFDMRGYPRGTAWAIAPRINTRKPPAAALFYRPLLVGGNIGDRLSFLQELPPTTTPVYERPTAMLIDERAISQAEHTGLFFKAANGTTFIGSPTTGANGDVTTLVLPGGLRVSFTGHDVRWPDGRQLQRIGLVPDIEVKPTIAGLRAGRDEVLERAIAFLKSRRGSSSPPR